VSSQLLNLDASDLGSIGLRDTEGQNPVLEGGSNFILLNGLGKAEDARKIAETALSDPILGLVVGTLGGLGGLSGSLFASFLASLGSATALLGFLEQPSWRGPSRVGPFNMAAYMQSLGLRKLDVHVVLTHAGKLTMKFIRISNLAQVEFRLEVREVASKSAVTIRSVPAGVGVEVVQ
jgi:hypothetical protein